MKPSLLHKFNIANKHIRFSHITKNIRIIFYSPILFVLGQYAKGPEAITILLNEPLVSSFYCLDIGQGKNILPNTEYIRDDKSFSLTYLHLSKSQLIYKWLFFTFFLLNYYSSSDTTVFNGELEEYLISLQQYLNSTDGK